MKDKLDYAPQAPMKFYEYREMTKYEMMQFLTTGIVKQYYFYPTQTIYEK